MAKAKTAANNADEIAAIEELMSDLEARLRRLNAATKREASSASEDVGDFVSEALNDIAERVRESARSVGESVGDEATKLGTDTLKRLSQEVENRPLLTLALAAGIGFLIGLAGRR
jgi:ElaB/YqjD/DUF883 family membrane-anchored ribosome-binding protein